MLFEGKESRLSSNIFHLPCLACLSLSLFFFLSLFNLLTPIKKENFWGNLISNSMDSQTYLRSYNQEQQALG